MTATDIAVNMRTAALDGYDSGLCIVRVKANGDKRPEAVTGWGVLDRVTGERGAGWKRMQTERPPREMVERWFTDGHPGIGFVCGAVSGDLEVLEFEGLAVEEGVLDRFIDAVTGAGLGHLIGRIRSGYYERSPSGGIHLPYRIEGGQVPGNTKLAGRLATEDELAARPGDRIKGWIETRGQGGFVVCAPSHGPVHKSGRPYELLDGGFATIATISRDERDALIGVCRSLDKVPKDVKPVPPAATASARSTFTTFATRAVGDSWMDAVVDHLTSDTTLLALVERYGWKYDSEASGYTYVTRPGKDDGISGFINGSDRLGVHSSSTPFESNTGTTKCPTFDRLDVIAVYEYGGDRVAAARHIAEQTGIMTAWKASRVTAAPADTCPPSVDPETGEIVDSDDVGVAFDGYRLTESGNASRLIDIANGRLRYVHKWGRWIVYRGGRWDIDAGDALVTEQAKKVAKKLLAHAATMADSDERKRLFTWALRSESSGAVASMIRLARGDHRVLTQHDDLDADPYLLNVRNGTIDLRSGTLGPHNPGDLLTMQAPVKFDAMAKAPLWLACIERWQPDAAIREYLQREMGAGATGHPTETLSIHYGLGGNGKSKFVRAVQEALGDYAVVPHKSLLVTQRHEQHETVKADLFRKRLAIASETKAVDVLDDEQVKSITGGDQMRARRMREDPWMFWPSHTMIVVTNFRPAIRGRDEGIWRRVRLIPWGVTIPKTEVDINLAAKLRAESSGILLWLVEGARRFIADGLDPPLSVLAATAEYRHDEDTPARFVAECLEMRNSWVRSIDIKRELERWCSDQDISPVLRMDEITPLLKAAGCQTERRTIEGRKSVVWRGVCIADDSPNTTGDQV